MPLATKRDIVRLGHLCIRKDGKIIQASIVPETEQLIQDLPAAERFCERRRIRKEVQHFLRWKLWIYDRVQYKKKLIAERRAAQKRFKLVYNWSSKTVLGQPRKTWDKLNKNYQVNGPQYVRFINQVADIMQGRLGSRKRWFYLYFHPSQFRIDDPHAPRTATQITHFLQRFTFMDRDDWKQLCVIALWEEFKDLSHLPHTFHAWRAIRKTMKKWFYYAYREAFRELILSEYSPDIDTIGSQDVEFGIAMYDLDRSLSMYNRYTLFLTCSNYPRSMQKELLYHSKALPLSWQYATISKKLKEIGYPIPSLKEQETNERINAG